MKRPVQKAFVLAVGIALMFAAGCGEAQTPSEKKSRLIAAKNIELKKQLAQRAKEIEGLKSQHAGEIKRQEKKLADSQKQTENCKKQLRQDIQEKVNDVLVVAMEEITELRAENETLKAQIEQLKAKSKD